MPFNRPSLATLLARAQADIQARLPGADATLRRTLLGVLARIQAGGMHGLYGYLDFLSLQLMPDTAETEHLDRWCSIWGVARKAATAAVGSVTFSGTNGSVIPAGTALQRSDGITFTTDAEGAIAAGVVIVAITADVAGTDGNTAAAASLSLVSPIASVDSAAIVDASGLASGTEIELDASVRQRMLDRIQEAPHGGASGDYVTWALEVAGVTRAWAYAQELGIGTVTVRFMMDDTYADGIPLAADVTAVQAYIDALRPVTAALTVVAPVAVPLDMSITLTPGTVAVKDAVETEIADLIRREAIPGGAILLSHLREAVSIAAGEDDNDISVPAADVTHTTGQIAVPGTITWL